MVLSGAFSTKEGRASHARNENVFVMNLLRVLFAQVFWFWSAVLERGRIHYFSIVFIYLNFIFKYRNICILYPLLLHGAIWE
jgi:hypothetical protein